MQKRYNRPVEVCFLCLNYIILVGSTTICLIFMVSFVGTLYHTFYKKKIVLLPTTRKIGRCLQVCMTRRSICIHRWFILSSFVVSWNRPYKGSKRHSQTELSLRDRELHVNIISISGGNANKNIKIAFLEQSVPFL